MNHRWKVQDPGPGQKTATATLQWSLGRVKYSKKYEKDILSSCGIPSIIVYNVNLSSGKIHNL